MGKIAINIATGSLQKEEVIVGIDLGTTNSLVAIIHPETGKPAVLREHDSSSLVPSVIYFDETGKPTVGDEAKKNLISFPQRTIFSAKRLMGKNYKDIEENASFFSYKIIDNNKEGNVKIKVDDRFYSPADLSSLILKELKTRAEHILKTPVNKAVITVPAYFNDAQRQATRDAGKLAGLDVLRIINEPTAASLAYGLGLNKDDEKIIAVYDLGGGTFDISILRLNGGIFEVLSTNGDTYLGGDDMDNAIVGYWKGEVAFSDNDFSYTSFTQEIRLKAEEAKKWLTENDNFEASLREQNITISKTRFNELIYPLAQRTIICCKNALKDAELSAKEIDEVIMVGGSTRVPLIREMIGRYLSR
jgi:molecular chaperone HscA